MIRTVLNTAELYTLNMQNSKFYVVYFTIIKKKLIAIP